MKQQISYLVIALGTIAVSLSFCTPAYATPPPPVILDITGGEHPKFQVTALSFAPAVTVDLLDDPHPFFALKRLELTPRSLAFGQWTDAAGDPIDRGVSRIELTGEAIPMTTPQGTQIVLAILGAGAGDPIGSVTGFWCDSEGDPIAVDQTTTFAVRGSPVVFTSVQQSQFRDATQEE